MTNENRENLQIISYLTLRTLIGSLGIVLPIILAVGGFISTGNLVLESSISSYYQTPLRDVLVGVLFVLGFFLLTYKGYKPIDNIAATLGFVFALGVALCPSSSPVKAIWVLHFVSAGLLFGVFVFFSLYLFTKTKEGEEPSPGKKRRNTVYWVCGVAIILFLVLMALCFIFLTPNERNAYKIIFWLESAALWAFGISWLVKGRFLWSSLLG
jgi:hypothetical protein